MLIMIIFLVLSFILIIATYIYTSNTKKSRMAKNNKQVSNLEQKQVKNNSSYKGKKTNSKKDLKDILDIKIHNSIINYKNRFSIIIELGSIDYHMLSDEEQETIENILMQTALEIDTDIQFLTTTEKIDTTNVINEIKETVPINPQIRECKEKFILFLNDLMEAQNATIIKNYAIISLDGENAKSELERKAMSFKGSLLRAKIECNILGENQIYNLLYRELNKNNNINQLAGIKGGEKLYVSKKAK